MAKRSAKNKPIFVVQEHDASHLHYDFRLEADGVLKSWAVPKQPTMDPKVKRLAVPVEDHDLDYADFEGTIPEGEYGAGTVVIWDNGTYENLLEEKDDPQTVAEGIKAGRLEFVLHGKKLKGRFALVRMKKKERGKHPWLLIKMKDEFAESETMDSADRVTKKSSKPSKLPVVTSPDKLIYPDEQITKGEVFEFYRRIAPRLLPHLRDRPITLERFPDGIGDDAPHFWQKNTPRSYPKWIPRVELATVQGKKVRYALVNDLKTLLYLVNQGALTFHVWSSRVGKLDRPDYVIFDLDPGKATFADVVAVAGELHRVLKREGRSAFLKTSGKSGLHILTAWDRKGGYDEARSWALEVAGQVVDALPDQATVEQRKAKRGQRVYVDVMPNVRGHHVVPPYVLRPVPGAPVSTPLRWRELTASLDPAQFNLKTIFRRLAKSKRDPMADLL